MKKNLLLLLLLPILAGCNGTLNPTPDENKDNVPENNNNADSGESQDDHSNGETENNQDNTHSQDNQDNQDNNQSEDQGQEDNNQQQQLLSFNLSSINYGNKDTFKYHENFGETRSEGFGFAHYRAGRTNQNSLMTLIDTLPTQFVTPLPGSFQNTTPILGINNIKITYQTHGGNTILPSVLYGNSKGALNKVKSFAISNNNLNTVTLDLENASYFQLITGDADLLIKDISIFYKGEGEEYPVQYLSSGEGLKRFNPITFEGPLVPGESFVKCPVAVDYESSGNNVTLYKTYTYYDLDYVRQNGVPSDAVMTDPIDVANYYTAFKKFPVNYTFKNKVNSIKDLFNNDIRVVSTYSRTDGYARSVPYQVGNDGKPRYHEFDINVSTYSPKARGVGRLVIWEYGFIGEGYDNNPVATFTDDHYKTFSEYYNNGSFSYRFNADGICTSYRWGNALTEQII